MSLLQTDLYRIAIHWNIHSTRKQKCAEVRAGKPDVLYFCPTLYGSIDYETPIDQRDVFVYVNYRVVQSDLHALQNVLNF